MREPLVSVVMCVRDGERYLREALDSIAGQRRNDLEVVVVDDGSKDDSAQIARDHPLKPEILSQQPLGASAALNYGIRVARGRYLAFLDCDDVWTIGRLDAMLAVFETDVTADLVIGKTVNTDERLNAINAPQPARLLGAMLVKRSSALRVGEFRTDIAHAAVVDWNSRATALRLRFQALNDIVLLRRIHGDNMGIRERGAARVDLLRVVRDHLNRTRQ
jgi:glycosyltransferase involved in cell wall biosynthesis